MKSNLIGRWGRLLLLCILLIASMNLGKGVQAEQDSMFLGEGTAENPYLIESAEHLFLLGETHQSYVGQYFRQTADIDLSGYAQYDEGRGWMPIGQEVDFEANYNGHGFNITGLMVNRPNEWYVGLFGVIGASAVVENLHISSGAISGSDRVGALAGMNEGTIINASSSIPIDGNGTVGGLVGSNSGEVIQSHASGDVVASDWNVGGLVGSNDGEIRHSYATGEVLSTGHRYTGGLVGDNANGEIKWSYATGVVTGNQDVGGLVGQNKSTIKHAYATGTVTGRNNVGGLVGINDQLVEYSYATGSVLSLSEDSGTVYGGLIGRHDGRLINSYATGHVEGRGIVGGLAGSTSSNSEIINAYASGQISNEGGGVVGFLDGGSFNGVYWNLDTSGADTYAGLDSSGSSHHIHGLNADEMKHPDNFICLDAVNPENPCYWDFIEVWEIKSGEPGPTLRIVLDREELSALIESAETILDEAIIGDEPGEYPESSFTLLQSEIMIAKQVMGDHNITQLDIDLATGRLQEAVDTFLEAVHGHDMKLVFAESLFEEQGEVIIELIFDHMVWDVESPDPSKFIISDPEVMMTDAIYLEGTGTVAVSLTGTFTTPMPTITMLPGAVHVDGYYNDQPSTVRIMTQTALVQLQDDLLTEAPGDKITIQHIMRYMSKPGADINGDGMIDRFDIGFLLRQIKPIVEFHG